MQRYIKPSAAGRGKTEFFPEGFAEPHPVLSKDRKRRAQREDENEVFRYEGCRVESDKASAA